MNDIIVQFALVHCMAVPLGDGFVGGQTARSKYARAKMVAMNGLGVQFALRHRPSAQNDWRLAVQRIDQAEVCLGICPVIANGLKRQLTIVRFGDHFMALYCAAHTQAIAAIAISLFSALDEGSNSPGYAAHIHARRRLGTLPRHIGVQIQFCGNLS
jgi:hypothetical protein